MLYFCQISQAANACSRSISRPFLTTAPFSFPFFMKRVLSGSREKTAAAPFLFECYPINCQIQQACIPVQSPHLLHTAHDLQDRVEAMPFKGSR